MKKGIFWLVEDEFVCVSVECDADGTPLEPAEFSSKSGENFNHRIEWEKIPREIKHGKAYNYYSRGRVEVKGGKATIWIAPSFNNESDIKRIKSLFGLGDSTVKLEVKVDSSPHYASESYVSAKKIIEEHKELFEKLKDR